MTHRYLLFHKPYAVVTQFSPPADSWQATPTPAPQRQTLKDFIPVPEVYPVGRLDHDSEGLLLLTNNGELQHRLSNPKFHHPRTYWVQVERIPTEADVESLKRGVMIRVNGKDYRTRPVNARLIPEPLLPPRDPPIRFRKTVPTAWLELTLTEGKNRQVRRMTAAIGFPTLRLVRVAITHLHLEGLSPGEWRDLTPPELTLMAELLHKNV